MPQMVLMWWEVMFITFMMIYMFITIIMYFMHTPSNLASIWGSVKLSQMSWKW